MESACSFELCMIKWQAIYSGDSFPPRTQERILQAGVNRTPLQQEDFTMKEKKQFWEDKEFSFFCHKKCEYFPCHETKDPENFNCLFCYCPLYALGDQCGGNFRILENGVKDCSRCLLPHKRENFGYVTGKYQEIMELVKKNIEGKK